MNKEDYNVEEALRSLSKKTNQETSQNGLVTIVYTGTGEIKDIKINAVLSDIDKAELEEEILNIKVNHHSLI